MTATEPLAYNVNQAAEVCGVARDTIVRAINAGQLKAKALSVSESTGKASKRVIRRTDLESWLDGLVDA